MQYRMHPSIRAFPSDYFYGGLLKDGPNVLGTHFTCFSLVQKYKCYKYNG